jgi:hypothetical protein
MPHSTVKLVSAEGFEFIVDYKAACVSNTIRNMLSSQGGEALLPAGTAAPAARTLGAAGVPPALLGRLHAAPGILHVVQH